MMILGPTADFRRLPIKIGLKCGFVERPIGKRSLACQLLQLSQ
jgi:hypothetical protein